MINQTIAHYRVTARLGAGGMGEVYRATDTKLGRDVALKVLPEAFAQDAQRIQRLQREAQLLAALNYPGIAAIYGFEEGSAASSAPAVRALVMELVEGPTLAERVAAGPVPVDEALPIAKQIAEALEYAHERGVIHRDLKPANIKLTADGKVKILDFGLAKALADDPAGAADPSTSPTLSMAATRAGIILGTAAYMSPEQAAGKATDRRCDIWSFGVVLWEMLTGRQLFTGETVSHVLAEVLKTEPDFAALPAETPPPVRHLLRRCLEKDRRRRLRDIGEAWLVLDNPAVAPGASATAAAEAPPQPAWRRALPWALAVVAMVAAILAAWAPWSAPPASPAVIRLSTEVGAGVPISLFVGPSLNISPDGTMLALRLGASGERAQLYLRRLDQLRATPLAGTEGARNPFFSPDGQWVAFFAEGKLKKVSVTGGAALTLCDAPNDRGGWWGEDGFIVFTPDNREALFRVSAAGGKAEPLTRLDEAAGEITHRWPQVLPGAKAVLYTAHGAGTDFNDATLVVESLENGERKVVHRGGSQGRYLPSGHLAYVHQGTLFAAPFDLRRMETTAQPAPVVEGLAAASGTGSGHFAASSSGTLVYLPGGDITPNAQISWLDAQGKLTPLRTVPANYAELAFSPDGSRLAVEISEGTQRDLWVYEWARDTMTRLTFHPGRDDDPAWSPDGRYIAFSSEQGSPGASNIFLKRADGTGDDVRLTESKNAQFRPAWHPSGKFLAFTELHPQNQAAIMILPLKGDEKSGWKPGAPSVFLSTPHIETQAAFSPDGRWLAYASNESGAFQVYVRPFPAADGKWQVSTAGGQLPVWSPNGRELFYRTLDQRIMVVRYRSTGGAFVSDKPELWSDFPMAPRGPSANFALHPDGKRFAVLHAPQAAGEAPLDKVVVVLNFFDELRHIAPVRE